MARPETDKVLAAIDRLPTGSRTPLSRWMRENHDALRARLEGKQPDWTALARIFASAGLTDRSGKPASPGTARAAWWRTRKAVAAARANARPPVDPSSSAAAPVARPGPARERQSRPPTADPLPEDDDPPPDKPAFRIGKLR